MSNYRKQFELLSKLEAPTWETHGNLMVRRRLVLLIMFRAASQLITPIEVDSGSIHLGVDGEAGVPLVCAVSKGAGPVAGDLVPVLCILRDAAQ